MASTTLILIFGTYFCWAAMVSRKLFHQVWAATLLCLVFLTDVCLQQESTMYSILYGTLCLLNLAVCIALSPAQVFLFKQKATYQMTRQLDVFLPKLAPESHSSYSISVDIIAVHGLGSSPEAAWAYKLDAPRDEAGSSTPTHGFPQPIAKSRYGPMWLRDFLPLDALQARVLVYYHNSGWQANALGMTLRDYGQDLLTSIEGVRQTEAERHRPVIFIGYSFGGLIIKQAMVMAHGVSLEKTKPVFSSDCAKGFIFLGTPHLGSELTIFAKILSLLGYWQGASTALLEVIDPRSLENKSLHEDFLYRFGNREMVNFYEVQPEYVGPFPIMNAVKKDSATILQKDNIPSPGKHRALHRFMSETDVGYTHLYQKIKSLVDQNIEKQGVPDVSAIKAHSVDVETDFRENFQLDQINVEGMEWFIKSPEYEIWLSSYEPQFLWYSGRPGSGKTTTASYIVHQIQQVHTIRTRLAFFFCAKKKKTTSTTVVASIISQLLDNDTIHYIPSNLQTCLSRSDKSAERIHENALWKLLEEMLNNLLESKERLDVRIVFDGIDELYPEDLGRFLSNFREVWNNTNVKLNTASKLKVLIISRPFPNISEILKDLPFINPEKESTDCLNSLSSMANNQRRGIISLGSEKTGAWLWEDDAYKLWSKETKSALLWIQGKPGSGKSTLCKKILKHLQTQHDLPDTYATPDKAASHDIAPQPRHRSVVLASFFYSLRGAKSEISNTRMLQSLLHQLLDQEQRLYPAFRNTYRNLLGRSQNPISWTFKDLRSVFTSLGEFDDFPLTIYLVIDAMDESEQSERSDILSLLQKFCQTESACVIKCVLASRPEGDIKDSFFDIRKSHNFFHLVLEEKNKEDIKKFIEIAMDKVQDAYLAERSGLTAEFKNMAAYVTANLVSKARGVFMWIEIVTRELERAVRRGVSPREFKEIVDELPDELEPFYERIVQGLMARFKIQGQKAESRLREAQRMLTWVTFAERPLSVSEFCDAVAIPELVEENSGINLQDYRLLDDIAVRQRMSVICGDLLEIGSLQDSADVFLRDAKDIVQLLHLTVREFLTSDPRAGKFLVEKNRGEYEIFLNCISYLRLFAENCPAPNLATNGDGPNYERIVRYLANWPLLSYILEFLPRHMQNSNNRDQISDIGAKFADFILHQEGSSAFLILEAWLHKAELCTHSHSSLERATRFRFDCMNTAAAEENMIVVATLLEAETAATTDNKYGNLLCNASRHGIYSLALVLLRMGVGPNNTGEDGNTALQAASAHGHRDIALLLLNHGADVNAQGKNRSALYTAVKNGSREIAKLLIYAGADVNAQGKDGSVLYTAVKNGSREIAELLIHAGADINAQGKDGSVLYAAINNGSREIAELLIHARADVDAQGKDGSVLYAAINNGSREIAELLIHTRADVNAQGKDGSALYAAVKNSSMGIVKILLNYGADINAQGEEGDILHTAIENGSADIIKLLLDHGADVNAQGANGSALDVAQKNGSEDIIQLLIEHGADAGVQGSND